MLRMVCAPTGDRSNSADHAVLVHVEDVEVGMAVREIEFHGPSRFCRSVGDFGIRVFEIRRED